MFLKISDKTGHSRRDSITDIPLRSQTGPPGRFMVELAGLYAPIAEDLESSARIFRDELESDKAYIRDLCRHVERYHGKRLRPALLLLSGRACGRVTYEHRVLAAVVEMVHIATLVHDDVLDEADTRRRAPTVNRMQGNEAAVLLGDTLISHAYHLCSSLESQEASRVIARTAAIVCEGELLQVSQRGNYDLAEAEYFEIIERKTASLIGACCMLGARYAEADEKTVVRLRDLGMAVGTAFQIADDLLDLTGNEREVGKSLGRDVEMGKITLPIIHFLRTNTARRGEMQALLQDGSISDRSSRIAAMLRASDSLEYATQKAHEILETAYAVLAELPATDARESLKTMTDFVMTRRH